MEKDGQGDSFESMPKSGQKRTRDDNNFEQGYSSKRVKENDCPYLNTIKRYMLDFDFK